MSKLTIAFLAAVSIASFGCKKKGGAGEAMAKMGEFKDKMCACKDKKCADDVQDQMNKWSAESAKSAGDKPEKPDEKTMKEMQDVGTKYGECMAKAMSGGDTGSAAAKPADPPPAPTGAKVACVDGAWKDPSNTYCVKVPEGFTPPKEAKKSEGRSRDQFQTDGNNTFIITVYQDKSVTMENEKGNAVTEGNGSKVVEKGDFEGGGFFAKHRNDTDKQGGYTTVVPSGDKVIICESVFSDDAPGKPDDACKTLRAM